MSNNTKISKNEDNDKVRNQAEIIGLLTKIVEALEKGIVELYNVELQFDEITLQIPETSLKTLPIPIALIPQKVLESSKPEVQGAVAVAKVTETIGRKILEIVRVPFEEPKPKFSGKVLEVKIGATKNEGGTRDNVIVLGGHEVPPYFYLRGYKPPHMSAFGGDIFDMRISLPKAVKQVFGDTLDNPMEWARVWVKKFGAEAIDVHLISTDPTVKDVSPEISAKVLEEILQTVKVPIVVGGSGNPEKDIMVFNKIVEIFPNEGLVLNSLNLDMDLEKVCPNIAKTNAVVINFSPMSVEKAEEINRKVYTWIPRNRIILDLNIGGIGYGTEYGFTTMERARLAALIGNELL
ncbi:MAG: hypothetical protein QXX89_05735, partial [Ignisphaera sp.]